MNPNNIETKRRFTTVLSARANDGRPSDLEFLLRSHCQKLRVVEKLSGAHILIPSSEMTIAIRTYFPCDLEELNRTTKIGTNQQSHPHPHEKESLFLQNNKNNFDNLQEFFHTFKLALVFFILPNPIPAIDDNSSYFHRAQRIARFVTNKTSNDNGAKHPDKTSQVHLFTNAESAVRALISIADAVQIHHVAKSQFFQKQHEKYYLPADPTVHSIPRSSAPAAARHVAEAFRTWAERFDLPPGEANVLMSLLGSMGAIIGTLNDDESLRSVPVDERTKQILRDFFLGYRQSEGEGRATGPSCGNYNDFPRAGFPQEFHTPRQDGTNDYTMHEMTAHDIPTGRNIENNPYGASQGVETAGTTTGTADTRHYRSSTTPESAIAATFPPPSMPPIDMSLSSPPRQRLPLQPPLPPQPPFADEYRNDNSNSTNNYGGLVSHHAGTNLTGLTMMSQQETIYFPPEMASATRRRTTTTTRAMATMMGNNPFDAHPVPTQYYEGQYYPRGNSNPNHRSRTSSSSSFPPNMNRFY